MRRSRNRTRSKGPTHVFRVLTGAATSGTQSPEQHGSTPTGHAAAAPRHPQPSSGARRTAEDDGSTTAAQKGVCFCLQCSVCFIEQTPQLEQGTPTNACLTPCFPSLARVQNIGGANSRLFDCFPRQTAHGSFIDGTLVSVDITSLKDWYRRPSFYIYLDILFIAVSHWYCSSVFPTVF